MDSNKYKRNDFIRTSYISSLAIMSFLKRAITFNEPVNQDKDALEELKNNGFVIIKNIFSNSEIQKLYESTISFLDNENTKNYNGDFRRFNANQSNDINLIYSKNSFITDVMTGYLGYKPKFNSTLAANLKFTENNLGSGQGWHRDSYSTQVKSIIYLTKVTNNNGPFEYIKGSHLFKNILRDSIFLNKISDGGYNQIRYSPEEIDCLIEEYNYEKKIMPGEIGDLIIADTRGLHRGHPIKEGHRVALTNYFQDLSLRSFFS